MSSKNRLETLEFEMYSKAGNKACASLVNKMSRKLRGRIRLTQKDVVNLVKKGIDKIAEKYPEVWDTEPCWHICDCVSKICGEVGYNFTVDRFEI